jgi:hypothetical protein
MSPSPHIPTINEEGPSPPLHNDDKNTTTSGNLSVASSSTGIDIDDPDFNLDPEAVDFEPLLVSGTGKILSYHSEQHTLSYHSDSFDDEDDDEVTTVGASTVATTASIATKVATNVTKRRGRRMNNSRNKRDAWSFPQLVRIASVLSLATFLSIRMLSRPQITPRSSSQRLQTTVAKSKSTIATSTTAVSNTVMSEAAIDSSYKPNRPLFDAIKSNNIELTRLLLDGVSKTAKETNNNYDVNAETEEGFTPLIEATLTGNVDLVKLLLNHGAKAQPAPGFRHTPLRAACLTANLELIRLLLDEGADPNAQSDGGRTPLMGACFLRPQFDAAPNREELSLAAVEVMLSDSRTIPEIRNSFGESALDLCQGRNYRKSSEILRRVLYRREKTGQAQKAAGTN